MKYLLALIFIVTGINHFIAPEVYLTIIPSYLPWPSSLNYIAGLAEILAGILLFFNTTQKAGSLLIILMLIAFIPAHIYMVQIAPFHLGSIIVRPWAAWLRIPLQFVLIWWAYHYHEIRVPRRE